MHIPNEAWRAAEKANRVASESERVTAIVAAAAPHIARAAQVAVLNEVHDHIANFYDEYKGEQPILDWIERKANELEAGASQAGEGNV